MAHDFNDRTGHCNNCDVPREYCHPEANAAENWRRKASELWNLVYELARWIPRDENAIYNRVTGVLDDGLLWLDGKVIECEGEE